MLVFVMSGRSVLSGGLLRSALAVVVFQTLDGDRCLAEFHGVLTWNRPTVCCEYWLMGIRSRVVGA